MAEAIVIVCDVCGKPATSTVKINIEGKNFAKDLCAQHLRSLKDGTRASRPGRKRKVA